jgi:Kef-type K+ transport system membrane component KefB
MNKNILFYIAVLLIFGSGIYFVLVSGSRLAADRVGSEKPSEPAPGGQVTRPVESDTSTHVISRIFYRNIRGPLNILLLQIIVIIIAARAVGGLFYKVGQPAVVGEMVAGILLGPSFLGILYPEALTFLFPASSMDVLRLLSQIGVIIFMFVVGMELNAQHLQEKAHAAVIVSHASIIIPFFLGITLSLIIYPFMASPNVSFTAFALFIGVAMSITAFPVLARIIEERGISKSYLGSTTIACAAVDDVTGWCILAIVIAVVRADGIGASMLTIVLTLVFIGSMVLLIKPRLSRFAVGEAGIERPSKGFVAGAMAFVFACAWFTELIGIHALFGAFLAGAIMPSPASFRSFLRERLETFSSSSLLPLFFAFTGLRTQITLLNDLQSWLIAAGVILVAIAGKLGGSMLAARWTGLSWQDSFSIGTLMNTRGLMELIVLNIGYDLGILPARIFAVMVLMALVTTCMTGPLLSLVESVKERGYLLTRRRLIRLIVEK